MNSSLKIHLRVALGAIFAMLTGCATFGPPPPPPRPVAKPVLHPFARVAYWNESAPRTGATLIEISLRRQRAYFLRNGFLVGESVISSGKKNYETATGRFKVIQKDKNHCSNLYGEYLDPSGLVLKKNADVTKDPLPPGAIFEGAKMPYFLRFTGGTGMHAGRLPGYAASHGCVRLPLFMARHFFENAELGTPVIVEK